MFHQQRTLRLKATASKARQRLMYFDFSHLFSFHSIVAMENPSLAATRLRLLVELSALRERYSRLAGAELLEGDKENLREVSSESNSSHLAQSDRDAIEAFFNLEDDFTRLFNQGCGVIERAGIFARVAQK